MSLQQFITQVETHAPNPSGWVLNLYPQAKEASGFFQSSLRVQPENTFLPADDRTRSLTEAARRARSKIRRYAAHNGLNRLGTLTFADACFDQRVLREHLGDFFSALRQSQAKALPYIWVPEWHKTHGLHAHFAVGQYIPRKEIEAAWPFGFVHIKHIGDLPTRSGPTQESRVAARYLSKYIGKALDDARAIKGMHRYDLAQGFTPKPEKLNAPTLSEVMSLAQERMKTEQTFYWHSNESETWGGAPAVFVTW